MQSYEFHFSFRIIMCTVHLVARRAIILNSLQLIYSPIKFCICIYVYFYLSFILSPLSAFNSHALVFPGMMHETTYFKFAYLHTSEYNIKVSLPARIFIRAYVYSDVALLFLFRPLL